MSYVQKGATISPDGKYRYRLWREWRNHPAPAKWNMWTDDGKPVLDGAGAQLGEPKTCLFVMLNPSTADGDVDDPTIRRCVGFAKVWQYDRVEIVNLFAFRATKPEALFALSHADDPVGWKNQEYVMRAVREADVIVCAWGAHGGYLGQNETVLGWIETEKTFSIGPLTKNGHPPHPLYLPAVTPLVPFKRRAA